MLKIRENLDIKDLHSFGISFRNKYWIDFDNPDELVQFLNEEPCRSLSFKVIGSGTNMLFLPGFQGLLLHPLNQDIKILSDSGEEVLVEVGAGLEWDALVEWAVKNNLSGIENLSLIPGTVGGAVVQNIGAYGREIEKNIVDVETVDLKSGETIVFERKECAFAYRKSIFKNAQYKDHLVWKAKIRLSKKAEFNISYGNLREALKDYNELNLSTLRQVIIDIRRSKLPDPELIGNAGSFFKNPVIDKLLFNKLKSIYPDIPSYPAPTEGLIKVPAGWLIDKAGLKGFRKGDAGVYEKQALVLVNHGNASGDEIYELSIFIRNKVFEMFGISMEPEVTIIGQTERAPE